MLGKNEHCHVCWDAQRFISGCFMFDAGTRKLILIKMQFTVVFVQKMHVEFWVNILHAPAALRNPKELDSILPFSCMLMPSISSDLEVVHHS
jgi:hypothetical protein